MKMNIEIPDEWETRLDDLAKQDGHSNRSAVIRKIVNLFFVEKKNFLELSTNKDSNNKQQQKGKE